MLADTQINKFISIIKGRYPHLQIHHDYNEDEDFHHIEHNYDRMYEDEEFPFFVGGLIRNLFFEKDIYNISFGFVLQGLSDRGEALGHV